MDRSGVWLGICTGTETPADMTPEKRYASENFKNSFVCAMKKIMLIIHCETDFGELFRPNGLELSL